MPKKTNLPALALVVATALASAALLRAEDDVIFKANFSDQAAGDKPQAETGKCGFYTGPGGSAPATASCTIAAVDAGNGSPQNAAALRDPSGEIGPVLFLDAGNFLTETSPDLDGIVQLKLLVPSSAIVNGQYCAGLTFGGLWRDGGPALSIRLERGKAWFNGNTSSPMGTYIPDSWMDLKVVLHFAGKTADIWWNGEEVAKDVPWQNPEPKDSRIGLQADLNKREHGDDPILCLAEAEIKLVTPAGKK